MSFYFNSFNYANQIILDVDFMSLSEPNRNWIIDLDRLKFKFKIHKSLKFSFKSYFFYFTPTIILKVLKNPDSQFILGGSWNNFNTLCIVFLKRVGIVRSKLHLWSEANRYVDSKSKRNVLLFHLKKYVYNSIDGYYIIPGKIAIETIREYSLKNDKYLYLPNLISNNFFDKSIYDKTKVNRINILIVARLEEKLKGILNFLSSIHIDVLKEVHIRIIGSGSSQKDYFSFIKTNNLINNIEIINDIPYDEMKKEYKNASFLVLPSFNDPSPLVLVEAIFSGIPILCSNRCGNVEEVLFEGHNGYSFDPFDSKDISRKFNLMISEKDKWPFMSNASYTLAHQNFNHSKIFTDLLTCLNDSKN
jgi:glycosyltransferase involved in cell wall biosynthesis